MSAIALVFIVPLTSMMVILMWLNPFYRELEVVVLFRCLVAMGDKAGYYAQMKSFNSVVHKAHDSLTLAAW